MDHKAQTCWFFIGLMMLILCFMYTIFCKFFGKSWLSAPPLCIPDLKITSQPQTLSLLFTLWSKVPHKLVHVSLGGNVSTHTLQTVWSFCLIFTKLLTTFIIGPLWFCKDPFKFWNECWLLTSYKTNLLDCILKWIIDLAKLRLWDVTLFVNCSWWND